MPGALHRSQPCRLYSSYPVIPARAEVHGVSIDRGAACAGEDLTGLQQANLTDG